jgi:hypothetical protein
VSYVLQDNHILLLMADDVVAMEALMDPTHEIQHEKNVIMERL